MMSKYEAMIIVSFLACTTLEDDLALTNGDTITIDPPDPAQWMVTIFHMLSIRLYY